jgi:hypothetical protein
MNRREAEDYCREISGLPITLSVSNRFKKYSARASQKMQHISIDVVYINKKALLWHETSHILFSVHSEYLCHIRAIQLALDRGLYDIVEELIKMMQSWTGWQRGKYLKAKNRICEELKI